MARSCVTVEPFSVRSTADFSSYWSRYVELVKARTEVSHCFGFQEREFDDHLAALRKLLCGAAFGAAARYWQVILMDVASLFSVPALFAEAAGDGGGMLGISQFLPFIVIGILFWMLLIRPESRKNAELAKLRDNLKKNDRVLTIGGIYGTVVNVQKDSPDVTIRVDEGNNTRIRILRSAISQVVGSGEEGDASKPAES